MCSWARNCTLTGPLSSQMYKWVSVNLRTFAPKSSHAQIFLKLATQKGNYILLPKRQKKLGVTDFVLERTYPEKYPKSEKSGFVS